MINEESLSFWIKVNELFDALCRECDLLWQKRKRILDTKLLMLFILKMVLSKNKQGYSSNLNALWESCSEKGIVLPQPNAIAASSICEARQKLPESIFKTLNNALITLWHQYKETPTWNGHRVFAIDSSKLTLPTGLLKYGYSVIQNQGSHYPRGLMSCLYNVHEQIIYDCELASHYDERLCAIEHLKVLNENDLVIFDRGYFSYLMLYMTVEHKTKALFRIQGGQVNSKIQEFLCGNSTDEIIEYFPSKQTQSEIKRRGYTIDIKPISLRLIKYCIGNETYVYATTLIDQTKYPPTCFGDLYHSRWEIEELYKISKSFIDVEDFHSQTERTVKQELYGHLLLINISRMFEHDSNAMLPPPTQSTNSISNAENLVNADKNGKFKVNFKNCISVVGRHLENLIISGKELVSSWLDKTILSIARVRQRIRPHRSYHRMSFKPISGWNKRRVKFAKA